MVAFLIGWYIHLRTLPKSVSSTPRSDAGTIHAFRFSPQSSFFFFTLPRDSNHSHVQPRFHVLSNLASSFPLQVFTILRSGGNSA